MEAGSQHVIRIAAALIDDDRGRLMLVRKAGTSSFMQAGGKIEAGETPLAALSRELLEEIGLDLSNHHPRYLGRYSAPAANEEGCVVDAELFHVRTAHRPVIAAEIAEAVWVYPADARKLTLAPLTRNHVLPIGEQLVAMEQAILQQRGADDLLSQTAASADGSLSRLGDRTSSGIRSPHP